MQRAIPHGAGPSPAMREAKPWRGDGPVVEARVALARIGDWATARGLSYRHDPEHGGGAVLSGCGQWRYLLWRVRHDRAGLCGMGMLNPSTADHRRDDPTIRQCRARARQARLGGLLVWNLFAFRATLPRDLKRAGDPIGPDNDAAIALALSLSRRTILGWGNHGEFLGRDRVVLSLCVRAGAELRTLGTTGRGQPRHPLYLRATTRLRRWHEPDLPSRR